MRRTNDLEDDHGFSLVELLIVIVILGILATVAVFAVREITSEGENSACIVELRNLTTAEEANFTMTGSYADEAGLVANAVMKSESPLYDVTIAADGTYAITAVGPTCTP